MTKAKTRYLYRVTRSVTQPNMWSVSKLNSEDLECESFYNVVEDPGGRREWVCSCPAYKPYCKHIFMVKAYRLALTKSITKGNPIISGIYDPSDSSWQMTTSNQIST